MFILISKRMAIGAATLCLAGIVIVYGLIVSGAFGLIAKETSVSAEGNWGLSFQEEGSAPIANATAEYLSKYNSYYIGSTDKKVLYLTFDAGYENGYTAKILDVLKSHKVKATFFLVGNYIETAPDLVKRMVDEGHTVGNHTYSHPDMSEIATEEAFREQLVKLEMAYEDLIGEEMAKLYRPPQGKYSESNLAMAKELGYKTIFWSLAYVDWYESEQPTREEALTKLIPRSHNGAIVLLHSTSKTNSEVLDELLTKWEEQGYSFGNIEDIK